MKRIITILFILLSVFSFSDTVSGKRIQVRGTSSKELFPDTAKVSFTIVTKNEDLSKASKENSELLEKYKNLLKKTNTKYEKINSLGYSTSETYWWDREVKNKGMKEFRTSLSIEVTGLDLNILKDFMSVLVNNRIYKISRSVNGNHIFQISEQSKTAKESYQKAINRFNELHKKLSASGIDGSNIKIAGYDNSEINMETYENVKKTEQMVTHTIEVITRDMKGLGNIINLAHSLEIGSTGTIEYDIDNKQRLEDELYENAYKEALKKAQTMLNKTSLTLKNPVTITDNSYGVIEPYYSYFNPHYSNYSAEILKERDEFFISKSQESNVIINPQKVNFSKTVYIEFEMD